MKSEQVVFRFKGSPRGPFAGDGWSFQAGEQWGVTGPNASGKSYLAALLSGGVPLRGAELEFAPEAEDSVACVGFAQQQEVASGGWLQERWHGAGDGAGSVEAFLSYESVFQINPFEIAAPDRARRRAFAAAAKRFYPVLQIGPLLPRGMLQLSNGETRRVLLCRAMLRNPKVLILDDPFAGLDPGMRESLKALFNGLAAAGTSLVIMVRNVDELPACTTNLLTLDRLAFRSARPFRALSRKAAAAFDDFGALEKRLARPKTAAAGAAVPVIELNGVTIRFGRRTLFDKLSWKVLPGERWLVVGANGSGKTTLLSLLTGDNPAAYANDVRVFGKPRGAGQSVWEIRSRISQVSPELQSYFDGNLTAIEAILSGRVTATGEEIPVRRGDPAKAMALLKELGIAERAHVPFARLSGGRQRLVLLARALFANPDLLLLDEPCLNLDAATKKKVLAILTRLLKARPGLTAVCVAHRTDDVPGGFSRVLNLNEK